MRYNLLCGHFHLHAMPFVLHLANVRSHTCCWVCVYFFFNYLWSCFLFVWIMFDMRMIRTHWKTCMNVDTLILCNTTNCFALSDRYCSDMSLLLFTLVVVVGHHHMLYPFKQRMNCFGPLASNTYKHIAKWHTNRGFCAERRMMGKLPEMISETQ